jgi:molybdenum cofactor cytidylyltransferase
MAKNNPTAVRGGAARIAAVVLAAGRSTRAGEVNKLLAPIDGTPMVACTVSRVQESQASPIIVVTGHEADRVRAALAERQVQFTHNPDFAEGMATSIVAGIKSLPDDVDGVLICLGDMPALGAGDINRLIAAFEGDPGHGIFAPLAGGRRGNPVLFAARFFPELQSLRGDSGAKAVIAAHGDDVAEVPMAGAGTLVDLDTVEEIADFVLNPRR